MAALSVLGAAREGILAGCRCRPSSTLELPGARARRVATGPASLRSHPLHIIATLTTPTYITPSLSCPLCHSWPDGLRPPTPPVLPHSIAVIQPFLNVYYRQAGLDEARIGALAGLRPWVGAVAGPAFTVLADCTERHRVVHLLGAGTALITRVVWIPQAALAAGYDAAGGASLLSSTVPLAAAVVVCEAMAAPVIALADAVASSAAAAATRRHRAGGASASSGHEAEPSRRLLAKDESYGSQRQWGAVAWGVGVLVAGGVATAVGRISVLFAAHLILGLVALVPAFAMDWTSLRKRKAADLDGASATTTPVTTRPGEDDTEDRYAQDLSDMSAPPAAAAVDPGGAIVPAAASAAAAVSFPEVLCLGVSWGVAVGVMETFLFLRLDDLDGPAVLWGAGWAVACVAEVPVFARGQRWIDRLGDAPLVHAVFAAFVARLWWYRQLGLGLLASPWWALVAEPLHGLTFAAAWLVGCDVARRAAERAGDGRGATRQGTFQGLYWGFGYGLGGVGGGVAWHRAAEGAGALADPQGAGARAAFGLALVVVLLAWLGWFLFRLSLSRARASAVAGPGDGVSWAFRGGAA